MMSSNTAILLVFLAIYSQYAAAEAPACESSLMQTTQGLAEDTFAADANVVLLQTDLAHGNLGTASSPAAAQSNMSNHSLLGVEAHVKADKVRGSKVSDIIFGAILAAAFGLFFVSGLTLIRPPEAPPNAEFLLGKKAGKEEYSLYDKFFFKHRNKKFGDNYEVAFRGAVVMVLFAIPLLLKPGTVDWISSLKTFGGYSAYAVQVLLFSYWTTAGDTLYNGWCCIVGTFLAVFTIWCMYGFFPNGVTPDADPSRTAVGIVIGSVFSFFMFFLNLDFNIVVFALSTFSWYWMSFLESKESKNFSMGFTIDPTGNAMFEMQAAILGTLLAVMATLLPFPILAFHKAQSTALETAGQLNKAWADFGELVQKEQKDTLTMTVLKRDLETLHSQINACKGYIGSCWYECFGKGQTQQARLLMTELCEHLTGLRRALVASFQCAVTDPDFSAQHKSFMEALQTPIGAVLSASAGLLTETTLCAVDGKVDEQEAKSLEKKIEETTEAKEALTKAFYETKKKMGIKPVTQDMLEEHVFCHAACNYARVSCKAAQSLLDEKGGKKRLTAVISKSFYREIFNTSIIFDFDHLKFATVNLVSFLACMIIGYSGYSETLSQYDANIPCTMVLLISTSKGNVIIKNISRLQGVVLGTAMGTIVHVLFGWCSIAGVVSSTIALFAWCLMGLNLYYNSAAFSYLGFLLVYFGSGKMMQSCSDEIYLPSGSFEKLIFGITTAVAIMTITDYIANRTPTSKLTSDCINVCWNGLCDNLKPLLDPSSHYDGGAIQTITGLINSSEAFGAAACDEPRFWKREWPKQSFVKTIQCMRLIRNTYEAMKECVPAAVAGEVGDKEAIKAEKIKDKEEKAEDEQASVMSEMFVKPSFKEVLRLLHEKMETQKEYFKVFMHEDASRMAELEKVGTVKRIGKELHESIAKFMGDVNASEEKLKLSSSLEYDDAARISYIIASLDSMRASMTNCTSTIAKYA